MSGTVVYKDYIASNIAGYRDYQRRALEREPEMTKLLRALLAERLDAARAYSVLDIGCGNGNTMFHLRAHHPHWTFLGVDVVPELVEDGRRLFEGIDGVELEVADAHTVDEQLAGRRFEVVLLWRVLQGLSDWSRALAAAFRLAAPGGHVIVSTLVNDADVDLALTMRDYTAAGEVKEAPLRIFSGPRVEAACRELGATELEVTPFAIQVDLPRPETGLNTFTVPLADGHRLQYAGGALVDHWKLVHARV